MIKQTKKIDSVKAMAAAQRSVDFWSSLDGKKLANVVKREKDMDVAGPEKKATLVRYA